MRRQCVGAFAVLLALGCSSPGGGGGSTEPAPAPKAAPVDPWPVKTSYVLDLWLHGYAMVQRDTTLVPYFRRGYREIVAAAKNRGVTTQLDANAAQLQRGIDANPALVSGQFLALQERTWEEMQADITAFLDANGDPNAARDSTMRPAIAAFAQSYRSRADRDWLQLFARSLADEHTRFYQQYWNDRQRELNPVLTATDSQFAQRYLPKLRGYLNNSQLDKGEILLSLPLDGEGRTITAGQHTVAVIFPARTDSAVEAVYTFVHEVAGQASGQAVADNTTPAEKQSGAASRYESAAAVRAGALLLRRTIPDLVTGYERYYIRAARGRGTGSDLESEFDRTFPLPQVMLDAVAKQIDRLLSTI
jgi:hypothetical protein